MSAADSQLSLLDRVVRNIFMLSGGATRCDLWHDAELLLCLCSTVFVVLLFIQWGSCFLSCSQLVDLPSKILLCTPSLLCILDVTLTSSCERLFLLVFRYGICLTSRTLLAMDCEPSRLLWTVPLSDGLLSLFIFWTFIYFLSHSFIILISLSFVPLLYLFFSRWSFCGLAMARGSFNL